MNKSRLQLDWPRPREFPTLGAKAVHVWAVPLDVGNLPEDALAETELERANKFALDRPRRSFVATRIALRSLLGSYLGLPPRAVPIAFGSNGKPHLAAGDLHFNLAHSGDLALIAITRCGPLGVDIEELRTMNNAIELANRNFHPNERAAIGAADETDRSSQFLRCWTRKEAVVKALAVGIGYPLDTFDVLAADVVELRTSSGGVTTCFLHDLAANSAYVAALATTECDLTLMGFTYST
ncbi:MAG: 4'-phosphopantetheinyl transferase superfamily protein [Pirellulales bacterium]